MPGKVKVKIMSGRNLPVMDRSSDTTDAYVELKLGGNTFKTDVCRKSLNPNWNSEWYKFELDDSELQDEPLQIRLMDHDTYSANDAIGKVYIDLNPLLLPATGLIKWNGEHNNIHEHTSNSIMSGWFPVYDTMHGIRGEVKVTVKVELFSDFNKFRQSSCGVHFFCSPAIPQGYHAQIIHGFVEELIVNDDPEYQWIDKIRTPRASNEARQTLFFKLSGELQRKIGVKALDLGGNAVIGYSQCFDLEGESGIVARGIGTAVTLIKLLDIPHQGVLDNASEEHALRYLKFLGSDNGFHLNSEPYLYVYNKYLPPPVSPALSVLSVMLPSEEIKSLAMERMPPEKRPMTRHLSQTDFSRSSPKGNIHHSSSLQTLLKQEDMRGTSSYGISQRFRNFKYSSQNMLSKKMTALKAKLSDGGMPEEQSVMVDQRKKKHLFKRTVSDSSAMAAILVQSVMGAHNSLDCIIEAHDNSIKPQMQKQRSLTEDPPDQPGTHMKKSPELESYLSLPDTSLETHSSNATTSCESSSDDEDNISDVKDDNLVLDTVSDIVKNVEIIQRKLSMQAQHPSQDTDSCKSDFGEIQPIANFDDNQDFEIMESIDDELSDNYSDDKIRLVNMYEEKSDLPMAQSEMFDICDNAFFSDELESNVDEAVTIVPPVSPVKSSGLFKTAMETMLLDKVNIIGTYTPPTSPTSKEKFHYTTILENATHLPQDIKNTLSRRSQSPTSFSLIDFDQKDSVLGAPFKSLHDLKEDVKNTKRPKQNGSSTSFIVPDIKKHKHFPSFKSMHNKLWHKHKHADKDMQTQSESLSDLQEHKESLYHWWSHMIKYKRNKRSHSPTSVSLAEYSDKEKVFGNFASLSLEHLAHKETSQNRISSSVSMHAKINVLRGPFTAIGKNISPTCSIDFEPTFANHEAPQQPEIICAETLDLIEKCAEANHEHIRHRTYSNPTVPLRRRTYSENAASTNWSAGGNVASENSTRPRTYSDSHKKHKPKHDWHLRFLKHPFTSSFKGKPKEKSKGLLQSALQAVLMESVNDILATSHTDSKENIIVDVESDSESGIHVQFGEFADEDPLPLPILPIDKVVDSIPLATGVFTDIKKQTDSSPINTKLDVGLGSNINTMHAGLNPFLRRTGSPLPEMTRCEQGHHRTESVGAKMAHSPAKISTIPSIHRRSSDSDLSITPKGNSLTGSDRSAGYMGRNAAILRHTVPQENFDIMEYPFLTMSKYPPGFIAHLGGTVSARSVKLLERITNLEEPESRDIWWSEIRMEIRSHARALNCNAVLGYTETTSICEDVCVLSATGTAAIIGYRYSGEAGDSVGNLPNIPKSNTTSKDIMTSSLDRTDFEKEKSTKSSDSTATTNSKVVPESSEKDVHRMYSNSTQACSICHLPYNSSSVQLRNSTSKCGNCNFGKVPDVLISTIEMPEGIPTIGRGCFLQSYVCRPLRDLRGESNAKEISDGLPFLEYELHRLLVNKLKVKGMNSIFGLKVRISIGERTLIGIATGTALFLSALPSPAMPKLVSDRSSDVEKLAKLQKDLHSVIKKNKEVYQLKQDDSQNGRILSDADESEEEQASLDLSLGNKDCCILEVDDPEDKEVVDMIMEPRPPDGFHVVNTELVPGLEELEIVKNLQMFTQIWRAKIQAPFNLDRHFHKLLQTVYFKLRRMIPCALCDLQFRVNSPEPDEVQLCVLGMALGLGDPQKDGKCKRKTTHNKRNEDDLIFNLEEDHIPENSIVQPQQSSNFLYAQPLKHRPKSPQRTKFSPKQRHMPYRERHGVDITPLSYVPGGKIERYLGNLNFFFIRETTSIREEGGLSGFLHSFVTEVLAIVRAHVTALGGNAMVAYFLTECILNHNLHKNQGQCLINVGGDVVFVSYYSEDI